MSESASHRAPPEYDANGVDRSLVRLTLEMTPAERVRTHDALLADVERMARAGEAASLERLLVVKRKLGRPKDLLMALQIEATLDEQKKTPR
jgi:hypothetical protein